MILKLDSDLKQTSQNLKGSTEKKRKQIRKANCIGTAGDNLSCFIIFLCFVLRLRAGAIGSSAGSVAVGVVRGVINTASARSTP